MRKLYSSPRAIKPKKKSEKKVYYFQAVPINLYESGEYVKCSCRQEYNVVAKNLDTALTLASNYLLENNLMLLSRYWRFIGTDTCKSGIYTLR